MQRRHRVVVVGAGFGGLAVAKGLRREAVDVVLVDQHNFHTFQPLLYQVATAGLGADDIAYPVRGIVRRHRNVTFRMGTVTAIDAAARTLTVASGDTSDVLGYDTLVLAAGAVSDSFGVSGVAEHAIPLKSLADAERIRTRVLNEFERAAAQPDALADGALNLVVCGGGPTGVELAGGVAELYRRVLARDAPYLDLRPARIVLVDVAERLLATFSEESSAAARRTLARRGVEVILGTGVARVTAEGVELADGRHVPAATVVWAAGVRAHPLAAALGTELDRRGRLVVGPDLAVPAHPEVFAIGDIAGTGLPQVAQPAIQGGHHVASQIARRLRGEPTEAFTYRDKGSMATIGRNAAVAEFPGGRRLGGFAGWVAWLGLHLIELVGMRNRLNVLVNWGWNYLTYDRGARLLAGDEAVRTDA
ncbi:MAG TPA: NAD(P)/FAD-dependent oxidoreductase [Ilumatobacter sp.]|nr:NAD(P)/FAD-dependent oxidoreductase [Ilumatobacter sp.]